MRATTAKASGFNIIKKSFVEKDTADYIFSEDERLPFMVSNKNFTARNRGLHRPTVGTHQSQDQMEWFAAQLVPTAGTIWLMVEYFVEGATISFPSKTTAKTIYNRISEHFSAHIRAQRTDKMYVSPDPEDFRAMAEFAMAIRTLAVDADPNIDKPKFSNPADGFRVRPTFSKSIIEETAKPAAKPLEQMDIIERYLERYGDGR